MSGEPEPRRSVRTTKGVHKALELDQIEPPKKRGKKESKAPASQASEPEEEIIRCVCGATNQDNDDEEEPWIACETCAVWQHNVCVGVSIFDEDVEALTYYCEQCRPADHKPLLDALKKGVKLWEIRRKEHQAKKAREAAEEDEAAHAKKKKGSKKGKGKRVSDSKEEPKPSPAPESKKESKAVASAKRKARDDSQEHDPKPPPKSRKVSEKQAVPVPVPATSAPAASPTPAAPAGPVYNPPADIAASVAELPDERRRNAAKGLARNLTVAIGVVEKKGLFTPSDGTPPIAARAERFALQIERAVHDTHPGHTYVSQIRTLASNLKGNPELALRLLKGTLTPPMLAVMQVEELASKELQREVAEMKARAEKQSILLPEEDKPRVRRTHKGEELVTDDNDVTMEEAPVSHVRRRSTLVQEKDAAPATPATETEGPVEPSVELPEHIQQIAAPPKALHVDTAQSPRSNFDINKVFSSVKSPTATTKRRQSTLQAPLTGPGIDPEVDRMIQDDGNESPPYSPTEESDPDVVWRGNLLMNTIAELQVVAKHIGGANLNQTIGLPWASLFPKRLNVAGRIDQQKAIEYLCSLRYSQPTDVVVASLEPATPAGKPAFHKLVDYFTSKGRYAVVGDKGVSNVRDTYLVPVLPGTGGHPEFMLNLGDNYIPETRTEPMLLCVFVFRNDPATLQRLHSSDNSDKAVSQSPVVNTPTPAQGAFAQRNQSISAPQFSPSTPHGPPANFQSPRISQTPVQPPHVPHNAAPVQHQTPVQQQQQVQHQPPPQHQQPSMEGVQMDPERKRLAQAEGERKAREVLGPLISSPTLAFIMPHAHRMLPKEWHLIREVYERDVRSREDLNRLSTLLAEGSMQQANNAAGPQQAPQQQQQVAQQQQSQQQQLQQPQHSQQQQLQPHQGQQQHQQQVLQQSQQSQLSHPQLAHPPQAQQPPQGRGFQPPQQQQQSRVPQAQQQHQGHPQTKVQLPPQPRQQQQQQQQAQQQRQQPQHPPQQQQFRAPPAQQTPIPPPVLPPQQQQQRTTPVPPPTIPTGPPRQTPIPPPNIPHHAPPPAPAPTPATAAASSGPSA